jgi:prepilin-type N-terminal cleavage/methylation domain-containing protein
MIIKAGHRLRNNAGFTMTELMVGILISTIILGATVAAMMTGNKNQMAAQDLIVGRQNARLALALVERDLRGAGFRLFSGVSPCGGQVYAHPSVAEVDDLRANAGSIRLTRDVYPVQIVVSDGAVQEIRSRCGGLSESLGTSYVFKVASFSLGAGSMTITLANGLGDPQPDPDWVEGTLLLACGGDEDAMGGVIYKVTGGSFASGYSVENQAFTGSDQDSLEAEYIRLNPKTVMDISFITSEVGFQIDRENKELLMKSTRNGTYEPILEGILNLRLLVDNGADFVPMAPGSTPTAIRVEVVAAGPDEKPVTVAGLVNIRNAP